MSSDSTKSAVESALPLLFSLGFLLHLIWFSTPLAGHMAIRLIDTAAMARNFYELGMNPLLPRIDWGGLGHGFVETEAPIYPWITAAAYHVTGVREWVGRLISLGFSLWTTRYVFLLGKALWNRRLGLTAAAVFFILPMETYYGATYINEPLLLLGSIGTVYHYRRWLQNGSWRDWAVSLVFLVTASVIKPPSLYMGLPLAVLSYRRFGWRLFTQGAVWAFAVLALASTFAYYYHARQLFHLFGNTFWQHGWGIWMEMGMLVDLEFYATFFAKILTSRPLTYGGSILFIIGLFSGWQRNSRFILFWLAGIFVYFIVVAKGNVMHDYYQMPWMLPGALVIAKGLDRRVFLPDSKRLVRILLTVAFLTIPLQTMAKTYVIRQEVKADGVKIEACEEFREFIPDGGKVIVLDAYNPLWLYYTHRKGWKYALTVGELQEVSHEIERIYVVGSDRQVETYVNTVNGIFPEVDQTGHKGFKCVALQLK